MLPQDELSPYAKSCLEELNLKYTPVKKLSATFRKREKYVCHGLNLKLYIELGLKLEKIHRVVEFNQADFMREFVDECSRKRREAVAEIDSLINKRIINSVFGKMVNNSNFNLLVYVLD